VIIALAGHGIQKQIDGKDVPFFCPRDAQLNDDSKLINLKQLFEDGDKCGAGVKLFFIDACRDTPAGARSVSEEARPKPTRGMGVMFSCKASEQAHETDKLNPKRGHGIFFHFLLEGLRGNAAANEEGDLTWNSLSDYVTRNVTRESPKIIGSGGQQTPETQAAFLGESPVLLTGLSRRVTKTSSSGKVDEMEAKEPVNKEPVTKDAATATLVKGLKAKMTLVKIPGGKFKRGSPTAEATRDAVSEKQVSETVGDFLMSTHEVTQAQFAEVMGYNPSYFSLKGKGKEGVLYTAARVSGGKSRLERDKIPSTDDFPVENISIDEAREFCKRLTSLDRRSFEIPTDAQWEWACRGGVATHTPFFFGNDISSTQANFNGTAKSSFLAGRGENLERTWPVSAGKANAFGLFNMHGNVAEWVADEDGDLQFYRGGSWSSSASDLRTAARPSIHVKTRSNSIGFRVIVASKE
jgi:formylglycine-generating enzyme required for sulfatase activity